MRAVPGDESDDSDEWGLEESDAEDDVGDAMYRDYRRMQRTTFLVAHISKREEEVKREMQRWITLMENLGACDGQSGNGTEEFALDAHDISLENVFVDREDNTKIVSKAALVRTLC
jgi:hypothetical protein